MESRQFFLCGEEPSTARSFNINPQSKYEDLRKAIATEFHIAQPTGMSFFFFFS